MVNYSLFGTNVLNLVVLLSSLWSESVVPESCSK